MSKRLIIGLTCLVFMLGMASVASADSYSYAGASSFIYDEADVQVRQHLHPLPVPLPYTIPPIYKNKGWEIYTHPHFKELTIDDIKKMKAPMGIISDTIRVWHKAAGDQGKVFILDGFPDPREAKLLGVDVAKGKRDGFVEEPIAEAIYKLKAKTGASQYLVFIKGRFVTKGTVVGLSVTGTAGQVIGPDYRPDEKAAAGLLGGSLGTSSSYIKEIPMVRVEAYGLPAPKATKAPVAKPKKKTERQDTKGTFAGWAREKFGEDDWSE